jgi:hypothetical protein
MRPGFDPGTFGVIFVALGQTFLLVLRSFPVSIIPPMIYTHLISIVLLSEGQAGDTEKSSKK